MQQENHCHQWWYTRQNLFMMGRLMVALQAQVLTALILAGLDFGFWHTFKKWFKDVFIPNLKHDSLFTIIGNNLRSHTVRKLLTLA